MHDCHFRLNSIYTEPLSKRKNNLINNLLFLNLWQFALRILKQICDKTKIGRKRAYKNDLQI